MENVQITKCATPVNGDPETFIFAFYSHYPDYYSPAKLWAIMLV